MRERKKQIVIVLIAYSISLLLRGSILLLTYVLRDLFQCEECEGVYILTSDYGFGQFLLILIEINQLIPHIVIPVALYIVPFQKMNRSSKDYNLESTLIEEDNDSDDGKIDHS